MCLREIATKPWEGCRTRGADSMTEVPSGNHKPESLNIILIISAFAFLYVLAVRPEVIACLFFTITIADINFEMAGMSFRAVVGLLLFLRTFFVDTKNQYPSMINSNVIFIFIYILYATLITLANDLASAQFFKITGQVLIAAFCGYHYFMKEGGYRLLKISLILGGLICLSDLVYTYSAFGSFPVQRIYLTLLKIPQEMNENGNFVEKINHNFFGQICASCFVFLLHEYVSGKVNNKLTMLILPLMLLGVLMSTSRSSLLGLIGISIYLLHMLIRSGRNSREAIRIIVIMTSAIVLSFMLFNLLKDVFNLKVEFLERITERMIDEPVAVINKRLGLNYNAQSLDALEWREEASSDAFEAFLRLKPVEQFFGIGYWGFITRNLGHTNLLSHNGFLLMLIENGILGFLFYMTLVFSSIFLANKYVPMSSPIISVLIFTLLYCIGQNGELTSGTTFLFLSTLIAQTKYYKLHPDIEEQAVLQPIY
jgi:hypothetical protein